LGRAFWQVFTIVGGEYEWQSQGPTGGAPLGGRWGWRGRRAGYREEGMAHGSGRRDISHHPGQWHSGKRGVVVAHDGGVAWTAVSCRSFRLSQSLQRPRWHGDSRGLFARPAVRGLEPRGRVGKKRERRRHSPQRTQVPSLGKPDQQVLPPGSVGKRLLMPMGREMEEEGREVDLEKSPRAIRCATSGSLGNWQHDGRTL
jgi:hypothetical protein